MHRTFSMACPFFFLLWHFDGHISQPWQISRKLCGFTSTIAWIIPFMPTQGKPCVYLVNFCSLLLFLRKVYLSVSEFKCLETLFCENLRNWKCFSSRRFYFYTKYFLSWIWWNCILMFKCIIKYRKHELNRGFGTLDVKYYWSNCLPSPFLSSKQ